MTTGDEYRVRAAAFAAKAKRETNPNIREEYENLSRAYRRLAEQADRNATLDLTYETPPDRLGSQQSQQQQQQQQQQQLPQKKKIQGA